VRLPNDLVASLAKHRLKPAKCRSATLSHE
jgi:hypothetical protein